MTELFHNLKGGGKELALHAGLTVPQFFVLKMVESNKGCKMGDLARALHLHFGTATSIVDRLIRDGLLARERDEGDRRVVRLYLTQEGALVMGRVNDQRISSLTKSLEALGEEELERIFAIFSKVFPALMAEVHSSKGN